MVNVLLKEHSSHSLSKLIFYSGIPKEYFIKVEPDHLTNFLTFNVSIRCIRLPKMNSVCCLIAGSHDGGAAEFFTVFLTVELPSAALKTYDGFPNYF